MSYPQPEKGGYDAGFGQQAPPPAFGQQAPPPGYQPTGYPNQAYNPGPHQEHHQMHLQNTTIVTGQPAPAVNTVIVSAPPIRPASYLGLAIFVTLCCNLPFGEFLFELQNLLQLHKSELLAIYKSTHCKGEKNVIITFQVKNYKEIVVLFIYLFI